MSLSNDGVESNGDGSVGGFPGCDFLRQADFLLHQSQLIDEACHGCDAVDVSNQ